MARFRINANAHTQHAQGGVRYFQRDYCVSDRIQRRVIRAVAAVDQLYVASSVVGDCVFLEEGVR
jgi:hypothetical protein